MSRPRAFIVVGRCQKKKLSNEKKNYKIKNNEFWQCVSQRTIMCFLYRLETKWCRKLTFICSVFSGSRKASLRVEIATRKVQPALLSFHDITTCVSAVRACFIWIINIRFYSDTTYSGSKLTVYVVTYVSVCCSLPLNAIYLY